MEERKGEYMYSELYTYPKDTEGAIIHSKSIPNIYPLKNIAVYRHEFAYAQVISSSHHIELLRNSRKLQKSY